MIKSKEKEENQQILNKIKGMSWVGHLSDDTEEIDFIISELKDILNEPLEPKDKVKVLKQLQDVEAEKAKRAIHLDNLMIKAMEIEAFKPKNNIDETDL